jgi:hypothetical protein
MTNRRDFIKMSAFLGGATMFTMPFLPSPSWAVDSAAESCFTLWQIPLSRTPTQGNSYVFRTKEGKVAVMDGGVAGEADYLRGFLAALGNTIDIWFLSHPHSDHIGALNEILKKPDDIKIKSVYHSAFSNDFYENVEPNSRDLTVEFYGNLEHFSQSGGKVIDVKEPGTVIELDRLKFKILGIKNEDIRTNAYNNSSMIIRVWDSVRSVVFLGDAGIEQGDRLLGGPFRKDLDCDYLQLAHHGQRGVSKDFYRTVKFSSCLWPTPLWLYNNDAGKGYNTHTWETVEIRNLMDELGIKKHFYGWQGLCVVD